MLPSTPCRRGDPGAAWRRKCVHSTAGGCRWLIRPELACLAATPHQRNGNGVKRMNNVSLMLQLWEGDHSLSHRHAACLPPQLLLASIAMVLSQAVALQASRATPYPEISKLFSGARSDTQEEEVAKFRERKCAPAPNAAPKPAADCLLGTCPGGRRASYTSRAPDVERCSTAHAIP